MSCILRIIGENFDVDDFILQSQIIPYKVFYKGHPIYKTKPHGKKSNNSGCTIEISKAEFTDFNQQVIDAINYLNQNNSKLQFIKTIPTIQYTTLDFGVEMNFNKFTQTHYLPPDLLKIVTDLNIGIELSAYQSTE